MWTIFGPRLPPTTILSAHLEGLGEGARGRRLGVRHPPLAQHVQMGLGGVRPVPPPDVQRHPRTYRQCGERGSPPGFNRLHALRQQAGERLRHGKRRELPDSRTSRTRRRCRCRHRRRRAGRAEERAPLQRAVGLGAGPRAHRRPEVPVFHAPGAEEARDTQLADLPAMCRCE